MKNKEQNLVEIQEIFEATPELLAELNRLLPQLSRSAKPLTLDALANGSMSPLQGSDRQGSP